MKKYNELYQEYPKVMKEYWEKRKVEHPPKRLLYNRFIKNDSMSDEAIAKRRKVLRRVQVIESVIALIFVAVFIVGILLPNKFIEVTIVPSGKYDFIYTIVIAIVIFMAFDYPDTMLKELLECKYRKNVFVLTSWCDELEANGFDASSYRSVINSVQKEVDERYFPFLSSKYYDVTDIKKKTEMGRVLAEQDEHLFDQFVEFLTSIIKENFDNYTGAPEDTKMVLKTYTFTPNVKYKDMPSYIKESYELACPVKKAEVQTNE